MEDEKVTVVIPVHNSEKFLECSIESVLHQSYGNLQIIAVDDGSTDRSLEILKCYKKEISVISQKQQGLASALNVGVKNMTGNWFKWLSPDDLLYPDAIKVLVEKAKKFPVNTILYSNWELIDEKSKTLRSFSESDYNELSAFEFNVRLLDGQQINVNTTIIPRYLFEQGCLFRNLKDPVIVDYDFFLRAGILYNTRFHLVKKILLKYRVHQNQLSHRTISKTLSFLPEIRKEILSMLSESVREDYYEAGKKYKKAKPLSKRTLELGLKFTTALPSWLSNPLVVLYLNKMRRSR